ncbi:MAG: hypothetical protein L5655_11565 [Thermosediminibacteraceae bacterium]|nr:hypothetical protein [Thermosediminibacteraceae bacterium]
MAQYQALVDVMVQHYKDGLEALEKRMIELEAANKLMAREQATLRRQYDALEDYATEQEMRANALHDVIDGYIERSVSTVRRDLLAEFEHVARVNNIDLENIIGDIPTQPEVIDLTSDEEIDQFTNELFGW